MKRWDSILLKVFLYGLPAVIILAIFSYSYGLGKHSQISDKLTLLNGFVGLTLALWMLLLIYLNIRLMFSGSFRNKVLARITFIKEADEREVMLTGKATKTTFLTSLAILIFLFFLSCFQVSFYRVPPEKAIDGKTRVVSLNFGFNLLKASRKGNPDETMQKTDIFSYTRLPLSSTGVILLLILWQIISYNFSMQRLIKDEHRLR
ncbi:MAG: hypothetical protein PHU44_03250 [Syntrophales bacterium]|nr:hypothetical protein [Syntrophales bacterium]MDD5640693.1 hypothetical protein [Syntrophales bacterium]